MNREYVVRVRRQAVLVLGMLVRLVGVRVQAEPARLEIPSSTGINNAATTRRTRSV